MEFANGSKYECLLFDMDDTLYPLSIGINLACRKNIQDYMINHLKIEGNQVSQMCLELYKEYGTTMAGLKALGFEFDNDEYHEYVHGKLPYDLLKPDPDLRSLLLSMPQRKIIFTNADKNHAAEVLNRLQIQDCFEGIICFETLNPTNLQFNNPKRNISDSNSTKFQKSLSFKKPEYPILCKPSIEAMKAAIQIANVDPNKTIFFDDSTRNISAGKATGLNTVIVGKSELVEGADFALESIHNIKEALPDLWIESEETDIVLPSNPVETIVFA
ncbi:hypothetical protein LUZ60_011274 [Juncus effusus]|nr:hypothetical protein LUZ60_011274 [Juncus effusus]